MNAMQDEMLPVVSGWMPPATRTKYKKKKNMKVMKYNPTMMDI